MGIHTALHLAIHPYFAEGTYYELVRALINAGCDTSVHNSLGKTALKMALVRGFPSVVEVLLSSGVPLPPDALLIATRGGLTVEMVEYLIHKGADAHSITSSGDTILHLACSRYYGEAMCYKLVKALINAGCSTNARSSTGKTALEIARERRFTSVVKLLHPSPPDVPLVAVRQGCILKTVEHLFQRGADVYSTTFDGNTVPHLALNCWYTEDRCYKLVKRLVTAGHDTNSLRETALAIAMQRNFVSVVELLHPTDVPLPPDILLIAVRQGSLAMIDYLIQRGANVYSTAPNGDTVLHLALSWKYGETMCCELVKRLVNAGCHIAACDSSGETALEIAIKRNFTSVAELLLPSDVPLPPDVLYTALEHRRKPQMIQVLVSRRNLGANDHRLKSVSGFDWDTLLQLARTAYSGQDSQQVMQILEAARKACRAQDETYMHVAKRPRLDEQELLGM